MWCCVCVLHLLVSNNMLETYAGWWYTYPSENICKSVGMIIPNICQVIKAMFQTTNQICVATVPTLLYMNPNLTWCMVNRLDYADYAKDLRPCNDWLTGHRGTPPGTCYSSRCCTSTGYNLGQRGTIQREVWESVGLDETILLLLSLSTSLGLGIPWRNAKL